jgi:hypothetical protein
MISLTNGESFGSCRRRQLLQPVVAIMPTISRTSGASFWLPLIDFLGMGGLEPSGKRFTQERGGHVVEGGQAILNYGAVARAFRGEGSHLPG